MRLFLRRDGPSVGVRLLSLITLATVAVACASASAPRAAAPAAAPPSAAPAASAGGGGGSSDGQSGGSGGSRGGGTNAPIDDAKIIRTGSLQLTVADVDGAVRSARDTVRGMGGYIGASQQQRNDDQLVATITYRIPVARWEDALEALRKLGTVIGEQTQATEVTGQLVDLDARIRNLKASEAALVGYAEKAPKVSDLLEIEARLTETRGEIERLSAQQASLTDQVALATLSVTYGTEVVAVTQAAAKWDPAAEVDRASATLINIVQGLISMLIVVAIVWVPVLIGVTLLIVLGVLVARRLGWRRSDAYPPAPPAAPVAPAAPSTDG